MVWFYVRSGWVLMDTFHHMVIFMVTDPLYFRVRIYWWFYVTLVVSAFLASRLWSCYLSRGVWWYDFIIVLWVWESGSYVWIVACGAADRGWMLSLLGFLFKNSMYVLCDTWCCSDYSDYSDCLHTWIEADLGLLVVRDSLNPMIIMIRLVCWSWYCICRIMFLLGLLITLCRFILVYSLLLMDPNDGRNGVHWY